MTESMYTIVPHNVDAILESARLGLFANGIYADARKALANALDHGKPMQFDIDAPPTDQWAVLYLTVDGERFQLSKKKLRLKDIDGILNGFHRNR